ncbi:hypothetical protein MRB53_019513 [Persea americana]|uniref:Uncharacterized protein n=1 Tax=Persea americana TaxID=3435 RepID=A0ACC2KYG6_PERAE|nr:hypothetical protein MRB53_019513 [Persea americana]
MATCFQHPLPVLVFFLQLFFPSFAEFGSNVHIVYMGERKHNDPNTVMGSHHEMLSTLLGSEEAARDSMVYSYRHGFSGFAAKLTKSQAKQIAEFPCVVRVIPNRIYQLQTTRSWEFLGVYPPTPGNILWKGKQGDGVIIGMVDTGIWPESDSFNDNGLGPVPSHWKGICQKGEAFNASNCNKKLIGARWFVKGMVAELEDPSILGKFDYLSPRDIQGHGTHTASTTAGSMVQNTSFMGLATGKAKGGALQARIAVYKACWVFGCTTADILSAFDYAIHDGVDVLSLSLGANPPLPSYMDASDFSVGAFHAVAKGITVVCAAGNEGPVSQTVSNTAPWIMTVGASTIDRSFPTAITLGNNITYTGQALHRGKNADKFYGLVDAASIPDMSSSDNPRSCGSGTLNATLARGKVVLCFWDASQQSVQIASAVVKQVGGAGVIFAQHPKSNLISCGSTPCVLVSLEIGTHISNYIKGTQSPTVKLSSSTTLVGNLVSPTVSYFSSRGPNSLLPAILKPDIIAPGSNILAAWSPVASLYWSEKYAIISGTSMACPHISGIVALIKSVHPEWSPAAIKSALVTTASTTDIYGQQIEEESGVRKLADPFDYGGGHVNPNAASDPGLVYDMNTTDNALFLCAMGYSSHDISLVTNMSITCPQTSSTSIILNLNLPSITIPNLRNTLVISRTVTKVGAVNAIYKAKVEAPSGVMVDVKPQILWFSAKEKVLSFQVKFTAAKQKQGVYTFGSLTWCDKVHKVRIPISVRTTFYDNYDDVS